MTRHKGCTGAEDFQKNDMSGGNDYGIYINGTEAAKKICLVYRNTISGFSKDGIRRGFYENPREDAVLMSLRLETLSGVQEE